MASREILRGGCEEIKETEEEHIYASGLYSQSGGISDRPIENRSSLVERPSNVPLEGENEPCNPTHSRQSSHFSDANSFRNDKNPAIHTSPSKQNSLSSADRVGLSEKSSLFDQKSEQSSGKTLEGLKTPDFSIKPSLFYAPEKPPSYPKIQQMLNDPEYENRPKNLSTVSAENNVKIPLDPPKSPPKADPLQTVQLKKLRQLTHTAYSYSFKPPKNFSNGSFSKEKAIEVCLSSNRVDESPSSPDRAGQQNFMRKNMKNLGFKGGSPSVKGMSIRTESSLGKTKSSKSVLGEEGLGVGTTKNFFAHKKSNWENRMSFLDKNKL